MHILAWKLNLGKIRNQEGPFEKRIFSDFLSFLEILASIDTLTPWQNFRPPLAFLGKFNFFVDTYTITLWEWEKSSSYISWHPTLILYIRDIPLPNESFIKLMWGRGARGEGSTPLVAHNYAAVRVIDDQIAGYKIKKRSTHYWLLALAWELV